MVEYRLARKQSSFPEQPRRGAGSGGGRVGGGGDWQGQGVHLQAMGAELRQLLEQLPEQLQPCGPPPGQPGLHAAS